MHAETSDSDHHRAIDALAMLLDYKAAPAETAKRITMAYEDSIRAVGRPTSTCEPDKVAAFWALWMCEAIRRFDAALRRLVDLLVEISRCPDVRVGNGPMEKHTNGSVYWRDLPGWSFAFAEHGLRRSSPGFSLCCATADGTASGYDDPCEWSTDELEDYLAQAPFHLNATRFAATALGDGQVASGLPAEADFFLKRAIEQPYVVADGVQAREWEVLLPSAAAWFCIAGKRIYSICIEDELTKGDAIWVTRDEWGGRRRVWSRQLWEHWKARFRVLASQQIISDECRTLAGHAAEQMTGAEV